MGFLCPPSNQGIRYNFEFFGENSSYLVLKNNELQDSPYQLLIEVKYSSLNDNVISRAVSEKKSISFESEQMNLDELLKQFRPFKGQILIDGKKYDVTMDIDRVVFMRRLGAAADSSNNVQFITFGDESEQYLMHLQHSSTDFCQVFKLASPDELIADDLEKKEFTLISFNNTNFPLPEQGKFDASLRENHIEIDANQLFIKQYK
ncbi:MAG: hypothetical protein KBA06_02790 [Saprospiraceae bacterium]|nr:hypothetical protein [Saprospiraceae bacterium]